LYQEVGAALIQWLIEKWAETTPASCPMSLEEAKAFETGR